VLGSVLNPCTCLALDDLPMVPMNPGEAVREISGLGFRHQP